jgi:hypothetical protein
MLTIYLFATQKKSVISILFWVSLSKRSPLKNERLIELNHKILSDTQVLFICGWRLQCLFLFRHILERRWHSLSIIYSIFRVSGWSSWSDSSRRWSSVERLTQQPGTTQASFQLGLLPKGDLQNLKNSS